MPLTKQEWLDLEAKANQLRHTALDTTLMAGSGHIGGSLSSMDILTVLYYKYMNIKKDDPLGRTATVSSSLRAISHRLCRPSLRLGLERSGAAQNL